MELLFESNNNNNNDDDETLLWAVARDIVFFLLVTEIFALDKWARVKHSILSDPDFLGDRYHCINSCIASISRENQVI